MKLAVLGSPIAHSRSPILQELFASRCKVAPFSYEKIETTRGTLDETVKRLVREGYGGFNCTMPLKTDMAALADTLTREAELLRSVNAVTVTGNVLSGATTDGGGILLTIRRAYGLSGEGRTADGRFLAEKKVLLLGAGGAARSAALSIVLAGADLTVLNRSVGRAEALAAMLPSGCRVGALDGETLCREAAGADILVNATPLGMTGREKFASFAFLDALPADAVVIDAVYEPLETALLRAARARGLRAMSGLWMLVYQGALSFERWTGILPDEKLCGEAFERIGR